MLYLKRENTDYGKKRGGVSSGCACGRVAAGAGEEAGSGCGGLKAIAGYFVLTLSRVLPGILHAPLLVAVMPRAGSLPGAEELFH
ncbi:hypothetical protein [Chitinophaga eiseniae]|uniref:hypothetical protein n=1 Tax=Chitinophaga eiseniae TaxID=634771 RepID=UPI000998EBEC|nr:hypothetical protein [Chitinophaga eiseniae]